MTKEETRKDKVYRSVGGWGNYGRVGSVAWMENGGKEGKGIRRKPSLNCHNIHTCYRITCNTVGTTLNNNNSRTRK